jgi:hypothetical protein
MKKLLFITMCFLLLFISGCEIDADINIDASDVLDSLGISDITDGGVDEMDEETVDICYDACDHMVDLKCINDDEQVYNLCKFGFDLNFRCIGDALNCQGVVDCFY